MMTLQELLAKKPEGEHCKKCGAELCFLPDADPHPAQYVEGEGHLCGDCVTDMTSEAIDEVPVGRVMSTKVS